MKAKELAAELLRNPELDVVVSIDISTCDEDYDHRAYSSEVFEVIILRHELTILMLGTLNYPKHPLKKE